MASGLGYPTLHGFREGCGFTYLLATPDCGNQKTDSKPDLWAAIQGNYFDAGRGFPAAPVAAAAAA